jgi:hypothetical protein
MQSQRVAFDPFMSETPAVAHSDTGSRAVVSSTGAAYGPFTRRTNMGKKKWLVALAGLLAAGAAAAENRTEMQITPMVGYSHLRIDGDWLESGATNRLDQLLWGASLGVKTPFNVVVEIGTANAVHEDWFSSNDFDLDMDFAALGYQADFGNGWRFVPKVGRMKWKLYSDDGHLVDPAGDRHKALRGYDNYFEASLMRHLSESITLGVNFKDVDTEFGHSRSGALVVTFGF